MNFSSIKKYLFLIFYLTHSWLSANLLHSVVEGDTLENISKKYGVKVERLRTVNKLAVGGDLRIGDTLVIPRAYDPVVVQPWAADPLPATESVSLANSVAPTDAQIAAENLESNAEKINTQELNYKQLQETAYQVQAGDTLISLANRYNTETNILKNINRLENDALQIGERLLVPKQLDQNILYSYRMGVTETLDEVAQLFKISVEQLRRLNNIEADQNSFDSEKVIYLNQVEADDGSSSLYIVKQGDTLWSISRQFGVSVEQIQQQNSNLDRVLSVGQQLDIPQTIEDDGKFYTIQAGDTAWSLAREYGVSVTELLELNEVDASTLTVGKKLLIPEKTATSSSEQLPHEEKSNKGDYIVAPGDTFWSIAQRFDVPVLALKSANQSENNFLTVGQKLTLPSNEVTVSLSEPPLEEQESEPSLLEDASSHSQKEEANSESTQEEPLEQDELTEAGEESTISYRPPEKVDAWKEFFSSSLPAYNFQPSSNYFEDFANDPLKTYRKAKLLLNDFDQKIAQLPQKSQVLKGYYFVIDPGHGGLDPGFVGVSEDGEGEKLYIIEDEYNYDLALRLYRELKLHGAKVTLTVISPNHQLINDYNPLHTFVSQKNEVYNSPFLNHSGDGGSWPIGNKEGLKKRRIIAERFFLGVPEDKRIFLSIHNDNTPEFGDGRLLLYYDDGLISSIPAANFARKLVPYLGIGAHYRGQNLGVLRDNPAGMALLLEMRNIAYQRNSWAIRYVELRQKDAELVAQALVKVLS